jgi:hypothetical protein
MGLLRQRDDVPGGRLFQMQEKLVSIGDDSWIEDDQGDRAYEVDGKALRRRDAVTATSWRRSRRRSSARAT